MVPVVAFTIHGAPPEGSELFASQNIRVELLPLGSTFAFASNGDMELAIIYCGHETDTGLSLLAEIKQLRPEIPVIFVTDARSEDLVLQAYKLGAREYFRSPFHREDLIAAVTKILRFKRHAPDKVAWLTEEAALLPLASIPPGLPERLQRVIDHIEKNLSVPLCLDELARHACMSKYHFCRLFKRHVGMSPKQFCICRKMELARQLLCRPDQSVTQTAFRLGFNDVTEFIRQFRKFTGLTPRTFRNSRCGILHP